MDARITQPDFESLAKRLRSLEHAVSELEELVERKCKEMEEHDAQGYHEVDGRCDDLLSKIEQLENDAETRLNDLECAVEQQDADIRNVETHLLFVADDVAKMNDRLGELEG